jgi:hypothetical protein
VVSDTMKNGIKKKEKQKVKQKKKIKLGRRK